MKTTQRLALLVVFPIAAACGVYLSESPSVVPPKQPLPIEVKPAAAGELLTRLAARGVVSANYDPDSLRILVSLEDEKKAVIVLAEEKLLSEAYKYGFHKMLARWSDEDPGGVNGEARLIESIDGIAEAAVFYLQKHEFYSMPSVSGDLSVRGSPPIAAVKVKLERETPLDEKTADVIIAIVVADHGLDPRDVAITDQFGNKFRSRYGDSYYSASRRLFLAADKKRWDVEFAHTESLRRKLEEFVRFNVPDIQYEGDVDVFIHCDPHFDAGEFAAKPEPGIESVSVVIHQPFHLKQDGGRMRWGGERGDTAGDPETRVPHQSVDSKRHEFVGNRRIEAALNRHITMTTGVYTNNRIWVHEIPWIIPMHPLEARDRRTEADARPVAADENDLLVHESGKSSQYPLPITVASRDEGEKLVARLRAKGIDSAVYDARYAYYYGRLGLSRSGWILVSRNEEKQAIIALAEEGLLGEAHRHGFLKTIERWAFPDSRPGCDDTISLAYVGEVSRLIESMAGIAGARVFHFENSRVRRLSDGSLRKIALVRVETKGRTPLERRTADAIIAIVATAKPGLDPRDVTVADQSGNKFHSKYGYSLRPMNDWLIKKEETDKWKWDIESLLGDRFRNAAENSIQRDVIQYNQYEGDVNVFPEYDVDIDFREAAFRRNLLAVSAVIHLPFHLKLEDDGVPVQSGDGSGTGVGTKRSWKRKPVNLLPPQRVKALQRRIAREFGIADADIPERVEIHQILWNNPTRSLKGDGTWADALTGERLEAVEERPEAEEEHGGLSDATTLDCGGGVKMDFVRIPAGVFMMGSPGAKQMWVDGEIQRKANLAEFQHKVTLSRAFGLGIYEVTQAQYAAVVGTNPSRFKGDDLPVEQVSWDDAMEFCRKLSEKTGRTVRLPTEAEWEYACRAGTTTAYYSGDDPETLARAGNASSADLRSSDSYDMTTAPVGKFQANAWGLYDMHGNVLEWCFDKYESWYGTQNTTDPQGASYGWSRVLRGGSWIHCPNYCRSAVRHDNDPGGCSPYAGFRVALDDE